MPKIVIVGASLAAVSAIEAIRSKDQNSEIVLFSNEGVLPYDRLLLPQWAAKQVKEGQLQAKHQSFFEQNKVQVILNEKLSRISLKRKQLTTENKTHIPFDRLILLDLGEGKLPHIKGHHRKGVFECYHWNSVKEIVKAIPFIDNIVITVNSFQGLNMACALNAFKKEVVVVLKGNGILSEVFDEETSALLKQIVEGKGIRVVTENRIEDILGDTEVKAVKLSSGKVMAAEMVILDELVPQTKLLADTGLLTEEQPTIAVDAYLKTADDHVYAADVMCCGYGGSKEESQQQGFCAGANACEVQSLPYHPPLSSYAFGLDVVDGFAAGMFRLSDGGREFLKFDGPQNVYKKIFAQGHLLKGTVLFNASGQKERILQSILQETDIAGQEEALLD